MGQTPSGLVNAAAATGAILAPPLIVFLFEMWGWRTAFIFTGALGFVWMFFWLRWYWPPAQHARVTTEEVALIESGLADAGPPKRKLRWGERFQFRQTWGCSWRALSPTPSGGSIFSGYPNTCAKSAASP